MCHSSINFCYPSYNREQFPLKITVYRTTVIYRHTSSFSPHTVQQKNRDEKQKKRKQNPTKYQYVYLPVNNRGYGNRFAINYEEKVCH